CCRAMTMGRVTTSPANDSGASMAMAAAVRGQQSGPPIRKIPPFTKDRHTPPKGWHDFGPHSGHGGVGVGGATKFWTVPHPTRLTTRATKRDQTGGRMAAPQECLGN